MFSFILLFGILNMLGGRDPLGPTVSGEKWVWRWILPALGAVSYALSLHYIISTALWIGFSVLMHYPADHSFEEIHGQPDPKKYPAWVRWLGYRVYPDRASIISLSRNRLRGALMKGLAAHNEYPTFALLAAVNPWAPLIGLGLFAKGYIYWAVGRIVPENIAVPISELFYWMFKACLIVLVIR